MDMATRMYYKLGHIDTLMEYLASDRKRVKYAEEHCSGDFTRAEASLIGTEYEIVRCALQFNKMWKQETGEFILTRYYNVESHRDRCEVIDKMNSFMCSGKMSDYMLNSMMS